MKIITNDYECGTSASIIDYEIEDVIVVSENNWEHLIDLNDDLFFVGHDFLFYMWDTKEKVEKWKSHKGAKVVWCFERINAIFEAWRQKSYYSLQQLSKFCDQVYCCDEDDVNHFGYDWLPQWGSKKFYDKRSFFVQREKILFSGQAGKPEYKYRNDLLESLSQDKDINRVFEITNTDRSLPWENFVINMLSYRTILNPIGTMRALNTRAYETIYSGRVLLQQTFGKYDRHYDMLSKHENIIRFHNI